MSVHSDIQESHDFDFLHGSWNIVHRRLKLRLEESSEWEEFPARGTCFSTLGGLGNVDDNIPDWPGHEGFIGQSFRFFEVKKLVWSIYWADSTTGVLGRPVFGSFRNGVGEFHGDDEHEGTPVRVRFRWRAITESSAHWDQAFSIDDGATWETNWAMAFTRA